MQVGKCVVFFLSDAYAMEQTMRAQKIAKEHKGHGFTFFEIPEEKDQLWKVCSSCDSLICAVSIIFPVYLILCQNIGLLLHTIFSVDAQGGTMGLSYHARQT